MSNDNPHSESLFKTAKYQPDFPRRFDNLGHANQWCDEFVQWYNFYHHHSNLAGYTPYQVFSGDHNAMHNEREEVLHMHYSNRPERFVKGKPSSAKPPVTVSINPYVDEHGNHNESAAVNFPTLNRVKSTLTSD